MVHADIVGANKLEHGNFGVLMLVHSPRLRGGRS